MNIFPAVERTIGGAIFPVLCPQECLADERESLSPCRRTCARRSIVSAKIRSVLARRRFLVQIRQDCLGAAAQKSFQQKVLRQGSGYSSRRNCLYLLSFLCWLQLP